MSHGNGIINKLRHIHIDISIPLLSTDEDSFLTRIFVFIRLSLVLSEYQQRQISCQNWHLFFKNEQLF